MKSMETTKIEVFAKKQKAKELKEKGNTSFAKKRYEEAQILFRSYRTEYRIEATLD